MPERPPPDKASEVQGDADRVMVEDAQGCRPFMRGIMVHALMARGIDFNEALRTADVVKDRIRDRGVVPRGELAKVVAQVLGAETLAEHQPPLPLPTQIDVIDNGESHPFSKGILSQSLLAASLDPNDAFDVARDIELELHRRGLGRVDRSELRRLAQQKLEARFGPTTASRFATWRRFQQSDKPLIILIGGATGSGKTSLALEVAQRLGIGRVLSTDSIREIMRIMLSPDLMPVIHVSSFEAYRHLNLDPSGDGPVVGGFMAQAAAVSVGVKAIMDRAVEENTSLVLDGVTLVPGLLDLETYADRARVIYLVLARLDDRAFRRHFERREGHEVYRDAARYVENMDSILEIQEHILNLADQYNVPIVDNVSLDGSAMLIIRQVVETLKKLDEKDGGSGE